MTIQCDDVLERLVRELSEPRVGPESALAIVRELVARDPAVFHAMEPVVKAFAVEPRHLESLRRVCADVRSRYQFRGLGYLADRNAAVRSWALTVIGIDTRPFMVLLEQHLDAMRTAANDRAEAALAREADVVLRGAFALAACDSMLEELERRVPSAVSVPADSPPEVEAPPSVIPRLLLGAIVGAIAGARLVESTAGSPNLLAVASGSVLAATASVGIGYWSDLKAGRAGRAARAARDAAQQAHRDRRAAIELEVQRVNETSSRGATWARDLRAWIQSALECGDLSSLRAHSSALADLPELFSTHAYAELVSRLERYREPVLTLVDPARADHPMPGSAAGVDLLGVLATAAASYRRESAPMRLLTAALRKDTRADMDLPRLPEELVDAMDDIGDWRAGINATDSELDLISEAGCASTIDDGSDADMLAGLRLGDRSGYDRLLLATFLRLTERVVTDVTARVETALTEITTVAERAQASRRELMVSERLDAVEGAMSQLSVGMDRSAGLQALTALGGLAGLWKIGQVEEQVRDLSRSVQRRR